MRDPNLFSTFLRQFFTADCVSGGVDSYDTKHDKLSEYGPRSAAQLPAAGVLSRAVNDLWILREVSQCPEKAHTRAFFLLKALL